MRPFAPLASALSSADPLPADPAALPYDGVDGAEVYYWLSRLCEARGDEPSARAWAASVLRADPARWPAMVTRRTNA